MEENQICLENQQINQKGKWQLIIIYKNPNTAHSTYGS